MTGLEVLSFFINPNGRISRKAYVLGFFLPCLVILELPSLLFPISGPWRTAELIVPWVLLWPSIAISVKRFHDFGFSGWWYGAILVAGNALYLAPMIALGFDEPPDIAAEVPYYGDGPLTGWERKVLSWELLAGHPLRQASFALSNSILYLEGIILALLPGHRGANKYGADPIVGGSEFAG
ncbi:MAG: DUF805 domain-containing protein [Pseudomonadota bacterium]